MTESGQLIYLVGASGAGKDTVLNAIRAQMDIDSIQNKKDDLFKGRKVYVMHRYITRPNGVGNENHIALTETEFVDREKLGLFALHWRAHNTFYAIGTEVDQYLEQGQSVVMNGSRAYFPEARKRYPNIKMVWVTVDPDVLEKRLLNRNRENVFEIQQRILRNKMLESTRPSDCLTIDNSGNIESTLIQFSEILNVMDVSSQS